MRREVVIGIFLLLFCSFFVAASCGHSDDNQLIMRLYSEDNSHVSMWDQNAGTYLEEICYNDIFGQDYAGSNPHECVPSSNPDNAVLSLYQVGNSHAAFSDNPVYTHKVCYGDLHCIYESDTVPLYRLYHSSVHDHFYTTSEVEKDFAEALGYTFEKIDGYIYPVKNPGTVPLYRLYHSGSHDHLYTTNETNKNYAEILGYTFEKVAGYVYPTQEAGTVPIYRSYGPLPNSDHFYTVSQTDRDNAEAFGYAYQWIEGYAYSSMQSEDDCSSSGYEVLARLYSEDNSHASVASNTDYPIKICCRSTTGLYWANAEMDPISDADLGDTVYLVAAGGSYSGDFSIYEKTGFLHVITGGDYIRDVTSVSIGSGILLGKWKITSADLDNADGDYDNFHFEIGGDETEDPLTIDPDGDDAPMIINISSPACASHFDEGEEILIDIDAYDEDDEIEGTVHIDGTEVASFTNGGIEFNYTFSSPGNSQIMVEASNTRGKRTRLISNVMILDMQGSRYVDGTYLAACIKEPKDFTRFPGTEVVFDASTTRGIVTSGGTIDRFLVPGVDSFSWNWKFWPDGTEHIVSDSNAVNGYNFVQRFASPGDKSASLRVSV
jgi:hypothetical protein